MEITLDSHLCEVVKPLNIGVIYYDNMTVDESPQMLKGRLQLFQESLFFDLEKQQITAIKEIQEWRSIFKQLGLSPNRYRPSSEALYRRIQKEQFLPAIQSAVDLNNFFSLKFKVPICIYDREKITGPVTIRLGNKLDTYDAINGLSIQLENFIISSDKTGAFGSPYVDSSRTAVSETTKKAIQIIYLSPSMSEVDAHKLLDSMKEMFTQISGGESHHLLLSCERCKN